MTQAASSAGCVALSPTAGRASPRAARISPAAPALSAPAPGPALRRTLSRGASFYLLASIAVSFLASSSAPTPLYPIYQAQWGFSSTAVTFIFGIYAIAVLASLLVAGRLSDYLGRRPILLAAAAAQALAMLLFAFAGGLGGLIAARVLQGLATGSALAAIGAGMLDVDKVRGAVANAVAPATGTALGGIVAGLLVHYLPAPTHLIYLLLAAVFVAQGAGVVWISESIRPKPGALASLRPQFSVPAAARGAMLAVAPVLIATWAVGGFYTALAPAIVRSSFGLDSSLLGGVSVFVLGASAAVAILLTQRWASHTLVVSGSTALLLGVALAVHAILAGSVAQFFIGTGVAGSAFGVGFQGSIRSVVPLAAPHQRAGVLSVMFVISYLAMGVPAVVAGYLIARHGNVASTARDFGAVVMALAAVALAATLQQARIGKQAA